MGSGEVVTVKVPTHKKVSVGRGKVVFVKVPTHEEGQCGPWEGGLCESAHS